MATKRCNTAEQVHLLNEICTSESNLSSYECFKEYNKTADIISGLTGVWLTLIGTFGILGNLATLITIPHAAKRKRHGLDVNFDTTTVFILHLSLVDLLHCTLMTLPRGVSYLSKSSLFGKHGCEIIMGSGMATFLADMLALSLVAMSRCFDMIIFKKWTDFCKRKRNIFVLFLLVWILSLLPILMMLFLRSQGVEIGWNCEIRGCSFVLNCNVIDNINMKTSAERNIGACQIGIEVWRLCYIFIFGLPMLALSIIMLSYLLIWYEVRKSKKNFLGTQTTFIRINEREMKMTRTILILIALNVMFWLLAYVILILKYTKDLSSSWVPMTVEKYIAHLCFGNIFESQYSLNFLIYVVRSDQYREAFLDIFVDTRNKDRNQTPSYNNERRALHLIGRQPTI